MNPAPPLPAAADPAAETQAEGRQHFLQSAAGGAEYQTRADLHRASARVLGPSRSRFPLAANRGQKSPCRTAVFAENFFSAISVKANG